MHIHINMHDLHIYICISIYIYIYTYIHTCAHTHTCTHIYIYNAYIYTYIYIRYIRYIIYAGDATPADNWICPLPAGIVQLPADAASSFKIGAVKPYKPLLTSISR